MSMISRAHIEHVPRPLITQMITAHNSNLERLKECIFVPIDEECGISASQTIETLLEAIFGSIYQYPCRSYNSTNPECVELLPKIDTKPHRK